MAQISLNRERQEKLATLKERVSGSRFSSYLLNPDLLSARHFFQICFAQRENIRRQKEEGSQLMKPNEFINASISQGARVFATAIVTNLEQAAALLECDACELSSDIIPGLPGNSHTPIEISMVFGLIKDGKISPVSISHEFILVQDGDRVGYACRYDEQTDFQALFRDKIKPISFV